MRERNGGKEKLRSTTLLCQQDFPSTTNQEVCLPGDAKQKKLDLRMSGRKGGRGGKSSLKEMRTHKHCGSSY